MMLLQHRPFANPWYLHSVPLSLKCLYLNGYFLKIERLPDIIAGNLYRTQASTDYQACLNYYMLLQYFRNL